MFLNVCFFTTKSLKPKEKRESLRSRLIFCGLMDHLSSNQEITHFNKILNQNKSKLSTKVNQNKN